MQQLTCCPVCGSDRIHHDYEAQTTRKTDARRWQVDRCEACTHGFMNPQPSWEELAPYYSETYSAYDPESGHDDEIVAQAQRTGEFRHIKITPGDKLLDVGCGGGFFLRIAARLGADVEGVEPSPVAAERCRATGLEIFTGTLERYAVAQPHKRFKIITANHVLEHVPDPVATLAVMKRLLSPGGMVWIAVPNADCDFCRTLKGAWHSADLPYHLMQFTPKSLSVASERAGMDLRSITTYSLPCGVAASIRQILRRRYLVPFRLTMRLGIIESFFAPRLAHRLDAACRGETILFTAQLRG
jgi:2-polyprenyl-3-methyl-5-hydroxy-6-metoxy-1,4-benzoquinol methylase